MKTSVSQPFAEPLRLNLNRVPVLVVLWCITVNQLLGFDVNLIRALRSFICLSFQRPALKCSELLGPGLHHKLALVRGSLIYCQTGAGRGREL